MVDGPMVFSFVHAKCNKQDRRSLWSMLLLDNPIDAPWFLVGDFNVIVSEEEKRGGLPFRLGEGLDFICFMASARVRDAGFSGLKFTWCNNRGGSAHIWKRLDRLLYNQHASSLDYNFTVQHLGRDPSDHAPLLLTALSRLDNKPKSFRFLNIWTTKPEVLGVIRQAWEGTFLGLPLQRLAAKLREVKRQVQLWSRDSFGDIFEGVRKAGGEVLRLEGLFDSDPSESNLLALQEARAGLRNSLMIEEGYWRQKARVKWIREGDKNSKYFHSIVTEHRTKAVIPRIKGANGVWLTEEDRIAVEAIEYFKTLFSAEPFSGSWDTLDVVPT
ncbi:uncharacterized protein [Coffea arabica]|uniref:Craniofacial development protein 2-like n=1 Tax=Coffea arabica TaxID=13443 RepID=A0ABM4W4I9_COFAR